MKKNIKFILLGIMSSLIILSLSGCALFKSVEQRPDARQSINGQQFREVLEANGYMIEDHLPEMQDPNKPNNLQVVEYLKAVPVGVENKFITFISFANEDMAKTMYNDVAIKAGADIKAQGTNYENTILNTIWGSRQLVNRVGNTIIIADTDKTRYDNVHRIIYDELHY